MLVFWGSIPCYDQYIDFFNRPVGFRNSGCSVEFKVLPGTQAIEHVENR